MAVLFTSLLSFCNSNKREFPCIYLLFFTFSELLFLEFLINLHIYIEREREVNGFFVIEKARQMYLYYEE